MEYIEIYEFLKQPIEVKKTFLDWWQPEKGDLIAVISPFVPNEYMMDCILEVKQNAITTILDFEYDDKQALIPLLTEGQLRDFINNHFNNLDSKIELEWCNFGYVINVVSKNDKKVFITNEIEPIKAYWKISCEIINNMIKKARKRR